ncbi:uncharacterized protein EDB91DRAFT_209681 [Suillus paluster]|uniref:uncharacterized protein n=1 Tax=Suillus paluster TaxID=48578 RepID=UPI001B883751|nr:uncharacterized protein EDB91DRAFT_209681 [Suillus paluster]KAG1744063.1 hypothetical protein EDB91DRAFT_209681 [Suillus paluster]
MLTYLTRFAIALALALSVLGAVIPATTVTAMPLATTTAPVSAKPHYKQLDGALWKNNVHEKIYSSEAPAVTAEGDLSNTLELQAFTDTDSVTPGELAAVRRSGELWKGREHEEVVPVMGPSRRSGELWRGLEHEEIAPADQAPSRRSGELWRGLEHEEIARGNQASSRRSGELWRGLEHQEISAYPDV